MPTVTDMDDEHTPKSGGLRFSREIRMGELVTAVSLLIGGFAWWGNFNTRIAGIENSQAAQAEQGRRLDSSMQEVKQEVKDTRESVRGLERRMDRARM